MSKIMLVVYNGLIHIHLRKRLQSSFFFSLKHINKNKLSLFFSWPLPSSPWKSTSFQDRPHKRRNIRTLKSTGYQYRRYRSIWLILPCILFLRSYQKSQGTIKVFQHIAKGCWAKNKKKYDVSNTYSYLLPTALSMIPSGLIICKHVHWTFEGTL